jgi:hypothetical protein
MEQPAPIVVMLSILSTMTTGRVMKGLCLSFALAQCLLLVTDASTAGATPAANLICVRNVVATHDYTTTIQPPLADLEAFQKEVKLKELLRFEWQVNQTNPKLWNADRFQQQLKQGETIWQRPDVMKELYHEYKRQAIAKNLLQFQRDYPLQWRAYKEKLQPGEPMWARLDLLEELRPKHSESIRQVRWQQPFIVHRYLNKPANQL